MFEQDRDVATLFVNSLPNTLDTTVRAVNDTDAFVITGGFLVEEMLRSPLPDRPGGSRGSIGTPPPTTGRGHRGHVAAGQRLPGADQPVDEFTWSSIFPHQNNNAHTRVTP